MRPDKLLQRIGRGNVQNVAFSDLCALIKAVGFTQERIQGSHHIFTHPDLEPLINIQDVQGEAKPYQVRQVLKLIEKYNLRLRKSS